MANQVNPAEFGGYLKMFTGGDTVYRYPFNSNFRYTEGAQFFLRTVAAEPIGSLTLLALSWPTYKSAKSSCL
jgi:hypothetical protein